MTVFSAEWVLPIVRPPIRQGYVSIAGGQVVAVGQGVSDGVNLGRVALLPALVNAHTHLELSYLRQQVPPGASFVDWVRSTPGGRSVAPSQETARSWSSASAGITCVAMSVWSCSGPGRPRPQWPRQ